MQVFPKDFMQPLPPGNRRQTLPRFIEIDGRRYLWRDLVALRHAQAQPLAEQPVLFPLYEDRRPPAERTAAGRYSEPTLFTLLERPD
jgi:hypothetical protein